MITIKVPATSANLGSGFDAIGVALQLYNTVSAEQTQGGLRIEIQDDSGRFLPQDERNLVYRAMQKVFTKVNYPCKGLHIIQKNDIPVTRGLGSSSASIVGGLLAANEMSGRKLSKDDLINMAAVLEGHPDNSTPALTGGVAVAVKGDPVTYLNFPIDEDDLCFGLFVPDFTLRTKESRNILPHMVKHEDAVYNTGRAALLTTALLTKEYDKLSVALHDRLHQPYRKRLIKGAIPIFRQTRIQGALGTYISGSGPAMMSVVRTQDRAAFEGNMNRYLKQALPNWTLQLLKPDNVGATIVQGGMES